MSSEFRERAEQMAAGVMARIQTQPLSTTQEHFRRYAFIWTDAVLLADRIMVLVQDAEKQAAFRWPGGNDVY